MVIKNLKLELLNVKSCSSKSNILRLDENESIKTPINVQNVNEADATKCITNSTFPGHFSKQQRSNLNQFVQWLHDTASQWTDVISCRGVTGSARLRAAASRRRKKGGSGSVSASAAAMRTRAHTHTFTPDIKRSSGTSTISAAGWSNLCSLVVSSLYAFGCCLCVTLPMFAARGCASARLRCRFVNAGSDFCLSAVILFESCASPLLFAVFTHRLLLFDCCILLTCASR